MTAFLPLQESIDFPASPFDNSLASPLNTQMSMVKVINSGAFRVDLPSLVLGNQTNVNFPTHGLVSNVCLVMKLTNADAGSQTVNTIKAGQFLNEGWGFDAIDYVEYSYGTQSSLRVTGDQIRIWCLSQCESGQKQKRIMELAGPAYATANGIENPLGTEYVAMVNLPLPHSNVNSGRLIPYDLTLLSNKPATIRIRLKYGPEFISQPKFSTGTTPNPIIVASSLVEAYVAFEQGYLADGPSDSISSLVSVGGGRKYDYPFMYPQGFSSAEFLGKSEKNDRVTIQLNNFLPGSVQSIDMWLLMVKSGTVGTRGDIQLSDSWQNHAYYVPMSNVEILYGGQAIYRCDDNLQELLTLSNYPTAGTFSVSVPTPTDRANLAFTPNAKVSQYCHVQLSQFNEQFLNLIQTGVSLTNSTVTVRFNTPKLSTLTYETDIATTTQPTYILRCSYNMQCSLRSAEGRTDVLFVRPERIIQNIGM